MTKNQKGWRDELREAYRDHIAEGRSPVVLQLARDDEEAELQVSEWFLFHDGLCAEVAAEFMREMLHAEPTEHQGAWLRYSAALKRLGLPGPLPAFCEAGAA